MNTKPLDRRGTTASQNATGLVGLIAPTPKFLLGMRAEDEEAAKDLGFSTWNDHPCPFAEPRLITAFRRGQRKRQEWAGLAWEIKDQVELGGQPISVKSPAFSEGRCLALASMLAGVMWAFLLGGLLLMEHVAAFLIG